jgi:hypothetical protein
MLVSRSAEPRPGPSGDGTDEPPFSLDAPAGVARPGRRRAGRDDVVRVDPLQDGGAVLHRREAQPLGHPRGHERRQHPGRRSAHAEARRGAQRRRLRSTGDDGSVTFQTIYPGWYSGRAIHIHFKVRLYDGSSETYEFTSQLFFDPAVTSQVVQTPDYSSRRTPDTSNATDNVYGSNGASLIVPLTGNAASGFAGTFVIGLSGLPGTTTTTTTTTPSGRPPRRSPRP